MKFIRTVEHTGETETGGRMAEDKDSIKWLYWLGL